LVPGDGVRNHREFEPTAGLAPGDGLAAPDDRHRCLSPRRCPEMSPFHLFGTKMSRSASGDIRRGCRRSLRRLATRTRGCVASGCSGEPEGPTFGADSGRSRIDPHRRARMRAFRITAERFSRAGIAQFFPELLSRRRASRAAEGRMMIWNSYRALFFFGSALVSCSRNDSIRHRNARPCTSSKPFVASDPS